MFLTPFRKTLDLQNVIDDFFSDRFLSVPYSFNQTMRTDVRETEKEYLIEIDMPGIKKEEINLEFNEGRLVISVSSDEQNNSENTNYIHRERKMTSMRREIYLKDVLEEGIQARLENGVLHIIAPKVSKDSNRVKIEIK